jgi:hypothetical protein
MRALRAALGTRRRRPKRMTGSSPRATKFVGEGTRNTKQSSCLGYRVDEALVTHRSLRVLSGLHDSPPRREGTSSLPISGQSAPPNRTTPGQSVQNRAILSQLQLSFGRHVQDTCSRQSDTGSAARSVIESDLESKSQTPDDETSAGLEMLREPGFVTSFLYFFKPPFPSDGGCAAASAGRSGLQPRSSFELIPLRNADESPARSNRIWEPD